MTDITHLTTALTGNDPNARKAAADDLGHLGTHEACAALIHALDHPLIDVRLVAAEGLSKCQQDAAVNALIDLVQNDPAAAVRQCAARSLGAIGRVDGLAALLDALGDSDPKVVRAAAKSLGELGDTRIVPNLTRLLKHADPVIRQVCAVALGQLRDVDALPDLVAALNDPMWMVRQSAAQALGELGEKSVMLALTGLLEDSKQGVRLAATEALKKLSG